MTRILVLTLIGLSVVGCNAVYTRQPVGEKPMSLTATVEEWEGTWLVSDGAVTVKVKDASQGVLSIGWFEEQGNTLKQHTEDVYLRDAGDWSFASLRDQDKPGLYVWGRIKKNNRQIFVWSPDSQKLSELVKAGTLPGTMQEGDLLLGNLGARELQILSSETHGVLFEWSDPLVLTKIGG